MIRTYHSANAWLRALDLAPKPAQAFRDPITLSLGFLDAAGVRHALRLRQLRDLPQELQGVVTDADRFEALLRCA